MTTSVRDSDMDQRSRPETVEETAALVDVQEAWGAPR